MTWQDIETAPKDGSLIIFYQPPFEDLVSARTGTTFFQKKRDRWEIGWTDIPCFPTHWQPLPEPPTD